MVEKNTELLPCPFCGEVPGLRRWHGDRNKWMVFCSASICLINPKTLNLVGKEKAIAVWNNRPGMKEEWTPVAEGSMPDYDIPVLVMSLPWPGEITSAMLVYEDGWIWAGHIYGHLNDPTNYEVDDDYQYTHWKYFPSTEIKIETKG